MSRNPKAQKARLALRQFRTIYHWRKRRIAYLERTYRSPKGADRKAREGAIHTALHELRRRVMYLHSPSKTNPFLRLLKP